MTEAVFQQQIKKICQYMHLGFYHTHDSRRSNPGFPDLVIVGHNGVMFRELKSPTGKVSLIQTYWLELLTEAGADVDIWRPADMPRIVDELRNIGRPVTQMPEGLLPSGKKKPTRLSPSKRRVGLE